MAFTSASADRKTSILVKTSRDLLTPLVLLGKKVNVANPASSR